MWSGEVKSGSPEGSAGTRQEAADDPARSARQPPARARRILTVTEVDHAPVRDNKGPRAGKTLKGKITTEQK